MPLFDLPKKSEQKKKPIGPEFIKPGQFEKEELLVARKIQQRRLQLLVHSRLYYTLNQNLVSDTQWSKWATELVELQNKFPEISSKICFQEAFKNWDGSTGAFLPLNAEWVIRKAEQLLNWEESE